MTLEKPFKWISILTLIVVALTLALSLLSLKFPLWFYSESELILNFVPTDIVTISVGLPVVLFGLWLTMRGKDFGRQLLFAGIFAVFYNYAVYLLTLHLNGVTAVYLVILSLSAFLLFLLAQERNSDLRNSDKRRPWLPILLLSFLGIFVAVRVLIAFAAASNGNAEWAQADVALWIVDLFFASPMLISAAVLLFNRKVNRIGFSGGVLLAYGVLSLELLPFFVIQAGLAQTPVDTEAITAVGIMSLLCFGFFIPLVKKSDKAQA